MQEFLTVNNLTFGYESNIESLFESVLLQLQRGWTGVVGANGSGKTMLLKLICGELNSTLGAVSSPGISYYCQQRTDVQPDNFEDFVHSTDKQAFKIKFSLQIEDDWLNRWQSLSHGERKRCQIATALFQNPSVLAIDEPSNHLDHQSKIILFNALKNYHGIGLLVSHDRELLDGLCSHTLFIFPPRVELIKCAYTAAAIEIERANDAKIQAFKFAKKEVKKVKRKVASQRAKADQADKKRSKRNIDPRDRDAKAKINLARLTGKDAVAGRIHRKMRNQLEQVERNKDSIQFAKSSPLGITFDEQKLSRMFPVFIAHHEIPLGDYKTLIATNLSIQYADKIGIVGDNGSGKSTFIEQLNFSFRHLKESIIYIPQEIPLSKSREILSRIQEYDGMQKGRMLSIIGHLASNPERLLETEIPSTGELRKLLLADGLMKNPGLIIMDEPTNHMDLLSMACVEQALSECQCAQLLVSHDYVFLKNIVSFYWVFEKAGNEKIRIFEKNEI